MAVDFEALKKVMDSWDRELIDKIPQLGKIEKKIKFPVVYLALGALFTFSFLIYLCCGLRAIVHLVAFVYPTWASLKAINKADKEDNKLWLAYWVFYGFFTVIESITDIFLFWIPFYELIKMCFYVYLYRMKGALVLYEILLKPLVVRLQVTEKKMTDKVREGYDNATNVARNTKND